MNKLDEFLRMDQLLRREFLLMALFTIGTQALVQYSCLSADVITKKSLGLSHITDLEMENIFKALTLAAARNV